MIFGLWAGSVARVTQRKLKELVGALLEANCLRSSWLLILKLPNLFCHN